MSWKQYFIRQKKEGKILFHGCYILKNHIKNSQACFDFNWIVLRSYAKGKIH